MAQQEQMPVSPSRGPSAGPAAGPLADPPGNHSGAIPDDAGHGDGSPEDDPIDEGDVIELTVPALTTYLSVVRTATAGLAARLSFTFDEIEDLRIAVDEACVMLLSLPGPTPADSATLTCRFRVLDDVLAVTVSARVDEKAVLPADQSFAWQVLTAHAAEVSGTADGGLASVELLKRRRR